MFMDLIKKLLDKSGVNDPNYPLLGPNVRLLKLFGIWHPVMNRKIKLKLVIVYLSLGFFFSQYIKYCLNSSMDAIRVIIKYVPFHTTVIKIAFFLKDHKKWSELIDYVSSVEREELTKNVLEIKRIMDVYIKYSQRLTFFYLMLLFLANVCIFTDLYQKVYRQENVTEEYIIIFDGYTPWSREPPGYYFILATQSIFANLITVYAVAWDPCAIAMMIFFAAQLKISGIYCKNAFNSNSEEENHRNIVKCHKFHTALVQYQEMFNSLISTSMFVNLIVISVNLGACIVEIVEMQDDLQALFSYCVFVVSCMVQLLMFYWHSNEVTEESLLVSYSTFESDWVGSSLKLKKEMIILAHATNKRLVFVAGPFNEMSLATFVSILRGSYSFYTLLNETN